MQTPEEIKIGLELCQSYMGGADDRECCDVCGYQSGCSDLMPDALAYIQQLETANAELLTNVKQLESKCRQLERERDAAVKEE